MVHKVFLTAMLTFTSYNWTKKKHIHSNTRIFTDKDRYDTLDKLLYVLYNSCITEHMAMTKGLARRHHITILQSIDVFTHIINHKYPELCASLRALWEFLLRVLIFSGIDSRSVQFHFSAYKFWHIQFTYHCGTCTNMDMYLPVYHLHFMSPFHVTFIQCIHKHV